MKAADKRALKQKLYRDSRGRCRYCNKQVSYEEATLDHVIPKSDGGRNSRQNIRLSCRGCNEAKGNMSPWDWMMSGGFRAD